MLQKTVGHRNPSVCVVKYMPTFPILPDSESPVQPDRAFLKASCALALLFVAEQHPLKSCPREVGKGDGWLPGRGMAAGKGDGCSLGLGDKKPG